MKNGKIMFTVLLALVFQSSFGQTEILGNWKVSCPFEKTSISSAVFCSLCPISQKNPSSLIVNDFEMKIGKTEITLVMDSIVTTVNYVWNEDVSSLEFSFKLNNYTFKVLSGFESNRILLKDQSGLLLSLLNKDSSH